MCLMAGHLQCDNAKPNVLQGSKGQPLAGWLDACRFWGFRPGLSGQTVLGIVLNWAGRICLLVDGNYALR